MSFWFDQKLCGWELTLIDSSIDAFHFFGWFFFDVIFCLIGGVTKKTKKQITSRSSLSPSLEPVNSSLPKLLFKLKHDEQTYWVAVIEQKVL